MWFLTMILCVCEENDKSEKDMVAAAEGRHRHVFLIFPICRQSILRTDSKS